MVRFVCPTCGTAPESMVEWLQVGSVGSDGPLTVQLLLDENLKPSETTVTGAAMEPVRTLRPCGHTFPDTSLTAVFRLLDVLGTLLDQHENATTPFETQCLRHEIHAVSRRLDAVAQQCVEQSTLIDPDRHQRWRSDERVAEIRG